MKNQNLIHKSKSLPVLILTGYLVFFSFNGSHAQYVSVNGAYISTGTGTVVKTDTLELNSSSTLANAGIYTQSSIINGGTLQGNGTYNISYSFTNTGTFTANNSAVNYDGAVNQNIPGLNYYDLSFSGGSIKTVTGTINVTNELNIGANTTLALGSNNIRLKSDSTYNARVGALPSTASITYGSGRFIAERYVKGRRKYRLVTSPVTTHPNSTLSGGQEAYSIWGNWQNQGNTSTPNSGTFITGGNSSDGYDVQTTNASMFTYNAVSRLFSGFTTANGKNTKYTPLKAGVAYYLFVYGDRTNSAYTNTPNKTVLTATGTLLTGDQIYTTSSAIPLTATTNGFTLLGNPFASAFDWADVSRTNIADTYWGWDPNLNSTGGYVTVNTSGTTTLISPYSGSVQLNQFIQPGQGFFVKTTGASPSLTIHEYNKVGNFNALAFRNEANSLPLLAVNLQYEDASGIHLMDGVVAAYDNHFSNTIGSEDASKIAGNNEVLSIRSNNELLSIEGRNFPLTTDTLFLHASGLNKINYRLQLFTNQMENTVQPYLVDSYMSTSYPISLTDTTYIDFSVDRSNANSSKPNRFYLVYTKPVSGSEPPESKPFIKIYPNPVTDHMIRIKGEKLEPGLYTAQLFNASGQLVQQDDIFNEGGSVSVSLVLKSTIPAGSYYFRLINGKSKFSQTIIIQ